MEIISNEIKNAVEIPSSLTVSLNKDNNSIDIKNEIRNIISLKNINLVKPFDMGSLVRNNNTSGNCLVKNLINLLREYYILKYKNDNVKDLTSRKLFDNMILSLECLMINNIDSSSEEVGSLIMGFLSKNLL